MVIHVVQKGETLDSIAKLYGVSVERLVLENELNLSTSLAIGETLVILIPDVVYTVNNGDSLYSIAKQFNIDVMQILRNNPYLSNREYIFPGETLVISYKENNVTKMTINAYAYPFINTDILKKTLPFLTYLTIFSYQVTSQGDLNDISDEEIIKTCKLYGVAPIMMVVASAQNQQEEINITHTLLSDNALQDKFITNVINILKKKGYYGLSINTPYIPPNDRGSYSEFVAKIANAVSKEGFKIFNTFSVSTFELLTGTIYKGIDYKKIGEAVDGVTIISYEWGYSIGIPSGTVSVDTIEELLDYTVALIPADKVSIGILDIGYVWKLPYEPGESKGMAVSYANAIELAVTYNAEILFDDDTNSAYFQYTSIDEYIVRFWDARSINTFVELIRKYKLSGAGIWNIMTYFPQLWLVINSQSDIEKVL